MEKDKTKILVKVLVLLVVVLGVLVIYAFVLRPAMNGYIVKSQNDGVQYAVLSIMQAAAKCQQVPLTFGNQTINIIAVECLKAAQPESAVVGN